MPGSNAFQYLANLPGSQPIKGYRQAQQVQSPEQSVQRFANQQLGGLMAGTAAQVGRQGSAIPRSAQGNMLSVPQVTARTTGAVRESSQRQLASAYDQRRVRARKAMEAAQKRYEQQLSSYRALMQRSAGQPYRSSPMPSRRNTSGGGGGGG